MRYNFTMRPRIIIVWLLVFFSAALLTNASAQASWSNFGSYSAADFYNVHLGLIGSDSGQDGVIQRFVDGTLTTVFITPVTQIAIQDSNRAWATDGDSLYLGTNGWNNWKTMLGKPFITLVRATPNALFVYSDSELYMTTSDTVLGLTYGIPRGDSIIAMDYISSSMLVAVSYSNAYRSKDGGANWTLVRGGLKNAASVFADTEYHLVYIGGDSVRVSADSGKTWSAVVPPPEFNYGFLDGQVFGARDCSGTFYVATSIPNNGSITDIMRSQNGGNTFEDVGQDPLFLSFGSTIRGWVFDRGSTVLLGFGEYVGFVNLFISHDGADGLIPDSVASAITVSAGAIYDTICGLTSVPFTVSVASAICTGVSIDSIRVVHSKGTVATRIVPQILFGNEATFALSYAGTVPGIDSITLRVLFHSIEWGFKEYADVSLLAYSVALPAELASTDSLQYGMVLLGASERQILQITNSGCSPLRVDSIVSSNPAVFSLPRISVPFYVKHDSTANINVTFSPKLAGPALESIELGTNAGHTFIELEGTGVKAADVEGETITQTDLSIFPNPASSILFVQGAEEENSKYEMIDLLGRIVQSGFIEGQTIPIAGLQEGMYLVRCGDRTARVLISKK